MPNVTRCCRAVTERTFRDDDPPDERRRKEILVPLSTVWSVVLLLMGIISPIMEGRSPSGIGWFHFFQVFSLVAVPVLTRRMWALHCELFIVTCALLIILGDWAVFRDVGSGSVRYWQVMVVVVDMALVLRTRTVITQSIVGCTLLWLFVCASDAATRWGLTDPEALLPDTLSDGSHQKRDTLWACADPPCALDTDICVRNLVVCTFTFTADYYLTRGFATSAQQAIDVARRVARSLGEMDVGEAEAVLKEEQDRLPLDLRAAYQSILKNLKDWRNAEEARRVKLEEERDRRNHLVVLEAEEKATKLAHPMVLTPAGRFIEQEKLTSYEELRDAGHLVFLDTEEKLAEFKAGATTIIFLSHQWLAWGDPDPLNLHHRAMKRAVLQAAGTVRADWSTVRAAEREPTDPAAAGSRDRGLVDNVYVWVDFGSIAQRHRGLQLMAVSALPLYASQSDAFVVVAPSATHVDTGRSCNYETYNSRGWCRAEMLSKVCGSGLANFYVLASVDGDLQPVTSEWLGRLSLSVFDGDFSCCAIGHKGATRCDKEVLMPAILGLYSLVLKRGRTGEDEGVTDASTHLYQSLLRDQDPDPAIRQMQADKSRFFPETFQFCSHEGWQEERELFGPMIGLMEEHIEGRAPPSSRRRKVWKTAMRFPRAAARAAAAPPAAAKAPPSPGHAQHARRGSKRKATLKPTAHLVLSDAES